MGPRAPYTATCAALVLALLASGCPQAPNAPPPPPPDSATPAAGAAEASEAGAIKVKRGEQVVYRIKPAEGGYKVSDEGSNEVYRVRLHERELKVKDAQDQVLACVQTDGTKFKVKDAKGEQELFVLRPQPDGDWKLETAADELVCKVKRRAEGWEGKDGAGAELFKVKHKEGKTKLVDAQDQALESTKDPVSALAFACLGLPRLSEPQRLGLMLLVQRTVK